MAKKKRPRGSDDRRGRPRRSPAPSDQPRLPDRRALEGDLQQLLSGLRGESAQDTPLAQAQQLAYRAFQEENPQRRVEFARQALALCPDCADAYVLLAEHAPRRKEALALYEQGVAAGERALGPLAFQEDVGHFWGLLETRPYMRARLGLAHALWTTDRRAEAVAHLQDVLRLNPSDNQGVRYTLAGFLFFLDRDEDVARLLEQYAEDGLAAWAYTRALLAFRQHGATPEARRLLTQARKRNRHVPDYVLGRKYPPAEPPGPYSPGDESEALNYLGSFLVAWRSTPGAIAWLRENDPKIKQHKAKASQPKGPLTLIKKWLKERLPQEDDVWQADCRRLPNQVLVAGEPRRLWAILVASRSHGLILAHDLAEEAPSAARLWDTLVQAMQNPAAGEPHRPSEVQVGLDARWESLRPHLDAIGITLSAAAELAPMAALYHDLAAHLGDKPQPGLLDMPGVTPAQVGSFFDAAASFFQQAPWKQVGYESALRVECTRYESGPWYAVLMGQSGLSTGLALFEDLDTLRQMWTREVSRDENAREAVGMSVTFGEEIDMPLADLEAAEQYGWKVARPDAYPAVARKERGLTMRLPLAWELELLEGCLRAVPDFVKRRQQDDATREDMTVPVASGELQLVLGWVVDEGT